MSKDIIVLTPNGRRQKVHCTPDTSILQVLEDVCLKQGFEAGAYDLKHHNHVLDLTTTIRFSNLPNKATLEMVEAERTRQETNVTIGLVLENGERLTGDFPPSTSLYDLVKSLAMSELNTMENPCVIYMRQEVAGVEAMSSRTLRQMGLLNGRAAMRLLNKIDEPKQANVSSVYRAKPKEGEPHQNIGTSSGHPGNPALVVPAYHAKPSTSNAPEENTAKNSSQGKALDPISLIMREKHKTKTSMKKESFDESGENDQMVNKTMHKEFKMEVDDNASSSKPAALQDNLERRLKIEEEVTFLGTQKAIAFMQPDSVPEEIEDLPDDFYNLSVEEVRRLYKDLQKQRSELENTPLLTANKREQLQTQTSQQILNSYKHAVVRIQFPDHMILQGVFAPANTIQDVISFIKEHLENPEKEFHIFTTPFKESLDPSQTLLQARFVPCVHMHFKWTDEAEGPCLKGEVYSNRTSSDAASILASKYRAPSRRKVEDSQETPGKSTAASSSKTSKVPKWFKN